MWIENDSFASNESDWCSMIYYKVVTDNLKSIMSKLHSFPEKYVTQYKIGEWTKPAIANTKLFVFNDLAAARRFSLMEDGRLYSCDVINPFEKTVGASFNFFDNFWKHEDVKYLCDRQYFMPLPNNTVFCDAVKLIEEIKNESDYRTV